MLACDASKHVAPAESQQLSLMLQSAQCVFPQVAVFLEFKDVCRLDIVSCTIIPEDWENEVWQVAANNAISSSRRFFRSFQLSNLDKLTVREFMKHVVYTTRVIDTNTIIVDSRQVADRLIQFACQMPSSLSTTRSIAGCATTRVLTRFEFDQETLEDYEMDPSDIPYSSPTIFDLGGDKYVLEMCLHSDGLKLSMRPSVWDVPEAGVCEEDESDDDEEADPVTFDKPLRVQLCSIASPVILQNEYVVAHVGVDVNGYGICNMPTSPEEMRKALVEGFTCMVSVAELTQCESDGGLPCGVERCLDV
jgi:hypothetical protein